VAGARFTRRFPEKILLTKQDLGYDEGRNLVMVPAPLFLLALRTGGAA
jgi:hypothetical protein